MILLCADTVGYVHRADGDDHLYFLSNLCDGAREVTAVFKHGAGVPQAWSVNTTKPMPITACDGGYRFRMEAHESVLVVFSAELSGTAEAVCAPTVITQSFTLHDWILELDGRTVPMDTPVPWNTLDGLAHVSGIGRYQTEFTVPQDDTRMRLELDGLSAAARVYVDGAAVGDIWTHPLSLELPPLNVGRHTLCIAVASTLINEMMVDGSYEVCPDVLEGWPYYGAVINSHRRARLNCMRESKEQKDPVPSVLRGTPLLSF